MSWTQQTRAFGPGRNGHSVRRQLNAVRLAPFALLFIRLCVCVCVSHTDEVRAAVGGDEDL